MQPPPPPPPPFFSPAELFSPEEMKADFVKMQENFVKMQELRKSFAEQLKQGSVSKEAILKHFAEIDQLMSSVRNQTQEKAAAKISSMSAEERQRFAKKLLRE
jgi:hypothetical protein